MPRTYSTVGKKVKQSMGPCEYCGYGLKWEKGYLMPSRWKCTNDQCDSHDLYDDYCHDFWEGEPDWTQG